MKNIFFIVPVILCIAFLLPFSFSAPAETSDNSTTSPVTTTVSTAASTSSTSPATTAPLASATTVPVTSTTSDSPYATASPSLTATAAPSATSSAPTTATSPASNDTTQTVSTTITPTVSGNVTSTPASTDTPLVSTNTTQRTLTATTAASSDNNSSDNKTKGKNTPPAIYVGGNIYSSLNGNINGITGLLLTFPVEGSDADGDQLTYTVANLPDRAAFNYIEHTFSWVPAEAGTYKVDFSVTDGKSLPVTLAVTLVIHDASMFQGVIICGKFTIHADGSLKYNLNLGGDAAWSPDGSKILYEAPIYEVPSGIWVINADGSRRTNLSPGASSHWSPDGSKIVFESSGHIYTINPDGTGKTNLGPGSAPGWSPDGQQIVFVRSDSIYTINADGSDASPLTDGNPPKKSPLWSPRGDKITFITTDQNLSTVWLMDSEGGNLTKIAEKAYLPVWSPDGTKLAYFNGHVNISALDGTIMASAGEYAAFGYQIKWTPDSKAVGYIGTSQRILELLYVDGHVSSPAAQVAGFAFSPDGQWVCYDCDVRTGLFVSKLDRSIFVKLTDAQYIRNLAWFMEGFQPVPPLTPTPKPTPTPTATPSPTPSPTPSSTSTSTSTTATTAPVTSTTTTTATLTTTATTTTQTSSTTTAAQIPSTTTIATTSTAPSPPPAYTLTVNFCGHGTVEKKPDQSNYTAGTAVTLTAKPDPGYVFCGWNGAINGNTNPVTLIINSNLVINAVFAPKAAPAPPPTTTSPPSSTTATTVQRETLIVIVNLTFYITQQGEIKDDVEVVSTDRNMWIIIPRNTVCKDRVGETLSSISIEKLPAEQNEIPLDGTFGSVYLITPDGATFDPAVVLYLRYDPASVPPGTDEENIVIAWWDSSKAKWVQLLTFVDTQNHVLYTLLTHVSIYSSTARIPVAVATATAPAAASTVTVTAPAESQAPVASVTSIPAESAAQTSIAVQETTSKAAGEGGINLAVILLVIGGLLFIAVIVILTLVYRSYRDRHNPPGPDGKPPDDENPS